MFADWLHTPQAVKDTSAASHTETERDKGEEGREDLCHTSHTATIPIRLSNICSAFATYLLSLCLLCLFKFLCARYNVTKD